MKNFQQVIKNSWNWISLSKFYSFFFRYFRGAHNVERAERESLRSTKNEENNVLDEDLIKRRFLDFSSSHYHIFITFSLTSLRNGVSSLNQYESASDKPKFILSP